MISKEKISRKKVKKISFKKTKNLLKNIKILQNFEASNIWFLNKTINIDKIKINLKIKNDPYKKQVKRKYQYWFYFKVNSIKDILIEYEIHNVNNYDNAWKGFQVCYSYDNINWNRTKTNIKIKKNKVDISWKFKSDNNNVWFAYYPPYPYQKIKQTYKKYNTVGFSEQGRPILMKKIGSGKTKVWIISGQHPGETINMWILEGFLKRLKEKKSILKKYSFFIVPCLNPDGNVHGYWRLNSKGINLNRDWLAYKSKETQIIKSQFLKYGFDLVIDLHGDEGSSHHFLAHSTIQKHPLHDKINRYLNKKNNNFQIENYYLQNNEEESFNNTLDELTFGITLEGAMKHKHDSYNTVQDEAIQIGIDLLNSI